MQGRYLHKLDRHATGPESLFLTTFFQALSAAAFAMPCELLQIASPQYKRQ